MPTTQKIIGVLRSAGIPIKKDSRIAAQRRAGVTVCKWNKGLIGLICNTADRDEIARIKAVIEAAGFKAWRPEGAAPDGLFIQ